MGRHAKFQIVKTDKGWRINVPSKVSSTGKRQQLFFPTREKAQNHQATLKNTLAEYGKSACSIKPSLAEDAVIASEILAPWGLSLTDAARKITAQLTRESASKPMHEATSAWLDSMAGLRECSIRSYKLTSDRLNSALGSSILDTVTAEQIQATITSKNHSPATYSLHRRNVCALWFWAAKKGWCRKEIFEGVVIPCTSSESEISFLSPDDCECLLRVAEKSYPLAVPYYAVALFAGIRAEEILRLDAESVSVEKGIELSAQITKKGRRRHITPS